MLSLAPDNLAAIRGLAEMHGIDAGDGEVYAPPAPEPFLAPQPEPEPEPEPTPRLETESEFERGPEPQPLPEPEPAPEPQQTEFAPNAGLVAELEQHPFAEPLLPSAFGHGELDLDALDASIHEAEQSASSGNVPPQSDAQRAAQIERLEIWLARLDELRRGGETDA